MMRVGLAWLALVAAARLSGPWGVAYLPAAKGALAGTSDPSEGRSMPAIVFLHGMWAGPEESCGAFVQGAAPFGFLVCPRGNAPQGEGRMWAGTYADAARSIRTALLATGAATRTATGSAVIAADAGGPPARLDASHDGTLIGYSNGAYFAAEVAMAEPGRWTGLVLLSMKLDLDAARLKNAGIRRVVLAAADKDGARPSMAESAAHLVESGLPTRFLSLGPGGHELPSDIAARMCEAIAWVRAQPESACAAPPTR
jgi:predicted esterase